MSHPSIPPAAQIAAMMTRIYRSGLTTISGGNLSIHDDDGSLWITPAGLGITPTGVDKGNLHPEDVAHILAGGTTEGAQRPSSEYPFHRAIYERRPDIRAVLHAHPSALVSFSLVHRIPEISILPQVYQVSGPVGFAPYALPGSAELGQKIAESFATGVNNVILENHGIVSGGPDLLTAFQRLEALEYAARIEIKARGLGEVKTLQQAQLDLFNRDELPPLPEFKPGACPDEERELRQQMVDVVRRGCQRGLITSAVGVISARLGDDCFLISPTGQDRESLTCDDIVRIEGGKREKGKRPSRSAQLHRAIYHNNPEVKSIIASQPVHAMAYAVSSARFDTHTIPESYILLVEMPVIPFEMYYRDPDAFAGCISIKQPVIIVENNCVMAVGRSLLQAFDRMEVAETSARALIETAPLGALKPIKPSDLDQLTKLFIPRL